MKAEFVSAVVILMSWSFGVQAADGEARCHKIKRENPNVQERQVQKGKQEKETLQEEQENWCYQKKENGDLYIYNADQEEVQQELSMVVEQSGTIVHSTVIQGELSTHRVEQSEINPLNIPIQEPNDPPLAALPTERQRITAEQAYETLKRNAPRVLPPTPTVPGEQKASTVAIPWYGFSWPFRDRQLFNSPDAPLVKYEKVAESETGEKPGIVDWESKYHADGKWWGGHCNGWAVSTILRKEPATPVLHEKSNTRFSVSDLKGLHAVRDYCAKVALYGTRYVNRKSDRRDVDAGLFHKVLVYYVGKVKKPVAIDFRDDAVVDTNVISGYDMKIENAGRNRFRVTTQLTLYRYDKKVSETVGPAPSYTRTYKYLLKTDDKGYITGSRWLSQNPDFVYVPLASGTCAGRHTGMDGKLVDAILKLPATE